MDIFQGDPRLQTRFGAIELQVPLRSEGALAVLGKAEQAVADAEVVALRPQLIDSFLEFGRESDDKVAARGESVDGQPLQLKVPRPILVKLATAVGAERGPSMLGPDFAHEHFAVLIGKIAGDPFHQIGKEIRLDARGIGSGFDGDANRGFGEPRCVVNLCD